MRLALRLVPVEVWFVLIALVAGLLFANTQTGVFVQAARCITYLQDLPAGFRPVDLCTG